jgi:predicted dehydrogenase
VSRAPVVALVGYGRWAPNIRRDLLELGCEVPVVARPGPGAERARSEGTAVHDLDAGGLPPADGFVVATALESHAAVVEQVLRAGVPVFVEKPLTASVPEAERLLELAPDRLFVMDKWRHHHGIEALRDLGRSGELGAVRGVVCIRDGRGDYRFDVDTVWRHLPHDLAIGLEVLGALPPARSAVAERLDGVPVGLHGQLGDGGGGPWLTVSHSSTAPVHRREVRVTFEHGSAWLADGYDAGIGVAPGFPGSQEVQQRPVDPEWPLLRELRVFVEHLAGGPPPRSSAADGVLIVRRLAELRALAGLA